MHITAIAYTVVPVTSLKIGRAFYEGVLGLKATQTYVTDGEGMVEYDLGSGTLAIGSGSPLFTCSPDGTCVALEVEDFDVAVADLKRANATFALERYDSPVCSMAIVRDPDGNKLLIHRRQPAAA